MFDDNSIHQQSNAATKRDIVRKKIDRIKKSQKIIKQIEKLEAEKAKLNKQIINKQKKIDMLLDEMDVL